ncbi:COR domain-containing protein [Emticicia sp. C21]|uniref:leucine-rich repeat domain-containing protein n=1 Tax=Emticicia sp. C21 TaxID=2302915 RepID=UPI000E34A257|nr:COR domain-containing protein [Emticicia sp. C21]RFS17059.1 TIR domain-containing protein [Emticicia sp. C21]
MSELALRLIKENKRTKDTFLDLGNCGLKYELPEELAECVWLESLSLGLGYFGQKQNQWLESKNTQSPNRFKGQELVTLQNLTRLRSLCMGSNKIQDISFLQNLTRLELLFLFNNQIEDISFLQSLTQLHSLYLDSNQIRDISFLQSLTQLQTLYLSFNQIEDISFLQSLTQLHSLYLDSNQIQDIPFLQSLTQLRTLDLRNNQIKSIRFSKSLNQLQSLRLSNNQIQDIKPLLFLIKNGFKVYSARFKNNGILLADNPIINPPIEIVKQGSKAIIRYFDRIEQGGHDFIFEAKLTLVGDGGSGKTSLQRRIIDENSGLPGGDDRTRGIKVYDWEFNDANGTIYTAHIWDFGGQDVYYPVHRFFLTENSVYILVASTRYSVHNFEYWIPTIYQFGGNSPIVLVQTCDNGNQKDWADIRSFYGVPEYNLKPMYKINLKDDNWGLKNLKGFIQHQITELPHIGKAVPKSWVKVREQLIEKAKTDDYISLEKFSELCKKIDKKAFSKTVDIEDLAQFLHDLGIILWYAKKGLLRNFVMLKPEWAMNAVYKIIDDTLIQEQNGIIYEADFTRIWGEETYQSKINELKLMLQVFKIAFPKQQQRDDYIIPARLNPIPDTQHWPTYENALRLEYHFDFMPRAIVNQLSADLSNKILSDESVWSDAVILKYYNSEAQIVEETHKKKILIKAKGHGAQGLMLLIMNSIDNIIHEYRGVVPLIRVPCNCEECQASEKPYIFEYEKLIEWLSKGRDKAICNESLTPLSISQLLYSVGFDLKKKEIQDRIKIKDKEPLNKPKKIFISYSQQDEDYKIDLRKHMISLKEEKLIEVFDDRQLELGDEWDKDLIRKIDECDYFICLISKNFLNVPYINQQELPRAYKAGKKIISIIIKPCVWMNMPINNCFDDDGNQVRLGQLNAHNKGDVIGLNENYINQKEPKALTEEERDYNWRNVVDQIRALIKKDS